MQKSSAKQWIHPRSILTIYILYIGILVDNTCPSTVKKKGAKGAKADSAC